MGAPFLSRQPIRVYVPTKVKVFGFNWSAWLEARHTQAQWIDFKGLGWVEMSHWQHGCLHLF
eukprot:2823947-Amphidinium_carterae.1